MPTRRALLLMPKPVADGRESPHGNCCFVLTTTHPKLGLSVAFVYPHNENNLCFIPVSINPLNLYQKDVWSLAPVASPSLHWHKNIPIPVDAI